MPVSPEHHYSSRSHHVRKTFVWWYELRCYRSLYFSFTIPLLVMLSCHPAFLTSHLPLPLRLLYFLAFLISDRIIFLTHQRSIMPSIVVSDQVHGGGIATRCPPRHIHSKRNILEIRQFPLKPSLFFTPALTSLQTRARTRIQQPHHLRCSVV